jgi:hypothetical protein
MIETKLLIVTGVLVFIAACMIGPAIYTWRKRRKD